MNREQIQRFTKFIQLDIISGCWNWVGAKDKDGYGIFSIEGKGKRAHRVSYEHWNGTLSNSLTIDHLCRNTSCVNPEHLQQVTIRINLLRGNTFQAKNAAKTHCPQGHPYAGDNLYLKSDGARLCLICKRESDRKIYYRKREAESKKCH